MSISLNEIKEKLHAILSEKDIETKGKLVTKFDDMIFLTDDLDVSEKVEEVLEDLAGNLEYYEADPKLRNEHESLYGDERLEREINEALQKIDSLNKK